MVGKRRARSRVFSYFSFLFGMAQGLGVAVRGRKARIAE